MVTQEELKKPAELAKPPEKKVEGDKKVDASEKNKESVKKIQEVKNATQVKKNELSREKLKQEEIQKGNQTFDQAENDLLSFEWAGKIPENKKTVKFDDVQKQQNVLDKKGIEVGAAIGKEIDTKLDAIKDSGTLEGIDAEERKAIHSEIIRQSIKADTLPTDTLSDEARKTAGGDKEFESLSKERQQELILQTQVLKNKVQETQKAYEEALKDSKNIENGIIKKQVLDDLMKKNLGLQNMTEQQKEAITLEVFQKEENRNKPLGTESSIEIARRIISEKGFSELVSSVGKDDLKWSQIPPQIKLQLMGSEDFQFDEEILSKNKKFGEDLGKAIESKQRKPAEGDKEYAARMQKELGVDQKDIAKMSSELPRDSKGTIDREKLSPFMRFIADIFSGIGAALESAGLIKGTYWRDYVGAKKGENEDRSERYAGKSGNNEYVGEVGTQSPELSSAGFKGDVMNSIWRWEYQPGHNVEVVNKGVSGLTLCGGIDLAYTPFSDVQSIFAGVLKPETIEKLKPFCNNGSDGPKRGEAVSLLKTKPELKQELNSQFTMQNMGEAFTRSLAKDWSRLVSQHGESVKNAPGYIQTIMLSRFYHDGSGASSSLIRAMKACNFDHEKCRNILVNHRPKRQSETYYRNRIKQELAYMDKKPGDAQPAHPNTLANTPENTPNAPGVQWFREHAGAKYGGGKGEFDCMTSTHGALGLDYTRQYAGDFNGKYIDRKTWKNGKTPERNDNNLWNVAMASAIYAGMINGANGDNLIKMKNGYYGDHANDIHNMEYYIEENVMKRVAEKGNIDVKGDGTLMHYSKKNGIQPIIDDVSRKLQNGEVAMMGATGGGTNDGGHEWLVTKEGDKLMVYDATNYQGQGVSDKGTELSTYLSHERRSKHPNEAIIFAKNSAKKSSEVTPGNNRDIFTGQSDVAFIGDSHTNFMSGNLGFEPYDKVVKRLPGRDKVAIPTVISGGTMSDSKYSVLNLINSPDGQEYIRGKKNIVITLGTNDAGFDGLNMFEKMRNIINRVRSINPEGKILVVTPPRNQNSTKDRNIAEYTKLLKNGNLGNNISIADFYTYSHNKGLAMIDSDHLSSDGYKVMKNFIRSNLA